MTKRNLGVVSVLLAISLLVLFPFTAGAQGVLGISTVPAKVDGVFTDDEYSLVTEAAGMKLGLTRTADVLCIGVSAPTTGWAAAGLGSARMDGAVIYIGYAAREAGRLKVQKAAGHRHADLESDAPRAYAVKEAAGRTVLELALDAGTAIARGAGALQLIVAMGGTDSFVSMHRARAGVTVALAK